MQTKNYKIENETGKNFKKVTKLETEAESNAVITSPNNSTIENQVKEGIDEESMDKVKKFYEKIFQKEEKIFSQNQEDGVLLALLSFLRYMKPGYYVEFGTESGRECNTRNLREKYKWKGKN